MLRQKAAIGHNVVIQRGFQVDIIVQFRLDPIFQPFQLRNQPLDAILVGRDLPGHVFVGGGQIDHLCPQPVTVFRRLGQLVGQLPDLAGLGLLGWISLRRLARREQISNVGRDRFDGDGAGGDLRARIGHWYVYGYHGYHPLNHR